MIQHHSSTAQQRAQWVSVLMAQQGTYGVVSHLSQEVNVSRQTLYSWKAKGQRALQAAFEPKAPQAGLPLERAVLTLLVEGHASYRGIQVCLEVLLGQHVSLGTISAIVQEAGVRAQAWVQQQACEQGRVLALDEQFGGQRGEGYLNVVDVHSGQVWASLPAVAVDGESWTLALWYLQEQGVACKGTVSDGGRAIAQALQTTGTESRHQRDVWHVLHLAAQVQGRLQRVVQEEEERLQRIQRREQQQACTGKKAIGRPAKATASQQEQVLSQMQRVLEGVEYLFAQLRLLLEVVVLSQQNHPRLLNAASRQEEVETVLALLEEVGQSAPAAMSQQVQRVSKQVRLALPALLLFAQQLEEPQQEVLAQLGEQAVGLIGWAWQRRAILGEAPKDLLEAMEPTWREPAGRLVEAWSLAVRASSAVENWHSILRPHLAVHRSLSAGLLALLAVWHNHKVAPRGLHRGQSPLMRSGMSPQSHDWLAALGYPTDGAICLSESNANPESRLALVA
jgi:hypothetical protein